MADKRESSRQQRARANRARREALAARTKAASTPREARVPVPPARTAPAARRPERGDDATATDRPARSERPRAARLGSTPVDPATMEGSWLRRLVHLPGGLQVLTASLVVVAITVMQVFVKAVPPEGAPRNADPTRTLFEAYGARALVILAPPVVMVALALGYAMHPRRRRAWIVAAFSLLMVGVVLGSLPYLMAGGFLGYGAIRSRQVEGGSWFGEGYPATAAAGPHDDREAERR